MINSQSLEKTFFSDPVDADGLWDGQYKIPWNDPDFSRRMLKEHLSQEHDLASRKTEMIQAQVRWIHENISNGAARKLLDLGCGPGFYIKEFCALGYDCCGIDFSPASIAHARKTVGNGARWIQEDIRIADFGSGYEMAQMIFGEFNVFSPEECCQILSKIFNALAPGRKLLIEAQRFDAVKRVGQAPNSWHKAESGLFSEHPHACLIENHWLEAQQTAVQRFIVIDAKSGEVRSYRSTTRAWSESQCLGLLSDAGFVDAAFHPAWPVQSDDLFLISAGKPKQA